MKAHFEIIQGTPEWHEIRYGKVGGTLSKGLFIKTDTLLIDLLSCKLEPFYLEEDGYESADMLRGSELEPEARKRLSSYTGLNFLECGWLQSINFPLLGISPDGITVDLKAMAEIKCPARKKHTATLIGNCIPDDNIEQCVHAFTVNPYLESLFFCSFRPESAHDLFVKELTRESKVDLGTKSKPNIKTVKEWVELAQLRTNEITASIKTELLKLEF